MTKKIIVVDDEVDILEEIQAFLEMKGYQTLTAHKGEDALQLIQKEAADLLLLDLNMPRVSGKELLRLARSLNPQVPAVIMSGDHEEDIHQKLAGYQPYRILKKPMTLEEVEGAVIKIFTA